MDPASAIVGFVGFGLDVFQKVDYILRSLKGAADDLKEICDRSADIEVLLLAIQRADASFQATEPQEAAYVQRLRERAQKCLDEVNAFAEKVKKASATQDGTTKIKKVKWLLKLKDYESTLQHMNDLEIALGLMMAFMNSRSQQQVTTVLGEVHVNVTALRDTSAQPRRRLTDEPISRPPNGQLQCLDDCNCSCHSPTLVPVIPKVLVPLVGQVFVPKRLVRLPWAPLRDCNVQTCRGDLKNTMPVRWLLPPWRVSAHLHLSSPTLPIYLTISLPRLVARNAPIWRLVSNGNVEGVRELFLARQASVFDVTEGGGSLVTHACRAWQQTPSPKNLEMIRFLVEAGADAGLSVATNMSAKDYLVLMSYRHLLAQTGRGFANSVKTSKIAVDIFRSLLDMDLHDALQDYLDRRGLAQNHQILLGLHEDRTQGPLSQSDEFEAFRTLTDFTPLEYSAILAPDEMLSLVARGEDASAGAPLCYALGWGHTHFIKPLLDAGADVNARDKRGMTALHYVCYYARYSSLLELVRWAEADIDWDACTREGKNALQLMKGSVSFDALSPEELQGFEAILHAHVGRARPEDEDDFDMSYKMPGAYPYSALRRNHRGR